MLRINGGPTGGGTVVKREKPKAWWFCKCETADGMKMWRGYWTRCPDCGEKRP